MGADVLQNFETFDSLPVEVPELNVGEYENLVAKLNMSDLEFLVVVECDVGDFENVAGADFNMGEFENMAVEMHMDAYDEFDAFTDEGDNEANFDDFESEDPDFRRVAWESSEQSESFGSFVDEEIEQEVNYEEQHSDEFEERQEKGRAKSDNEGESVNPKGKKSEPSTSQGDL